MLGWEDTDAEYIQHLTQIFAEVGRVLKPTGTIWVNIADTTSEDGFLLIPHQFVIALRKNVGLICCQIAIWHVPNRAPEASPNRFDRNHEDIFGFAKQPEHYFDAAAARQWSDAAAKSDNKAQGKGSRLPWPPREEKRFSRHVEFKRLASKWPRVQPHIPDGYRNPRTVWTIPTERFGGRHHCAFPKALVEPMLLSSCPEGGVCLDPFAGTGTVGLVALAHGRRAILVEANADYCGIAKRRIETELEPYKAELEKRRRQERAAALLPPTSDIVVPSVAPDVTAMREIEAA
jgi:site-specific DNA-methyltransferase (adenine-specific)